MVSGSTVCIRCSGFSAEVFGECCVVVVLVCGSVIARCWMCDVVHRIVKLVYSGGVVLSSSILVLSLRL